MGTHYRAAMRRRCVSSERRTRAPLHLPQWQSGAIFYRRHCSRSHVDATIDPENDEPAAPRSLHPIANIRSKLDY